MKLRTYSSLAAFIAHYESLRATHTDLAPAAHESVANPDDDATLAAMESILGELSPADRDVLHDASSSPDAHPSGAAARHRARAELNLRRLLAARGLLAG
jgi:hypothetical protein